MNASELVAGIDSEINLLKQARSLLAGIETRSDSKRWKPSEPPWKKAHSERGSTGADQRRPKEEIGRTEKIREAMTEDAGRLEGQTIGEQIDERIPDSVHKAVGRDESVLHEPASFLWSSPEARAFYETEALRSE